MVVYPNAKINLGLNIVSKRPDGYHNLETVFYPIPLRDCLEIVPAPQLQFSSSGIDIDCAPENNLCIKAYRSLQSLCPQLPPAHIHLHKSVPFGAGLGGGSADAAFVITAANRLFELGLSEELMARAAASVGSDCPFFVYDRPMFATGTGHELAPTACNLNGYYFVLAKPPVSVNTAQAYRGMVPRQPAESPRETVLRPVAEWDGRLINDFEETVFAQFPQIAALKDKMYRAGALYSAMSGSGSSVFGIFRQPVDDAAQLFDDCFVFSCDL